MVEERRERVERRERRMARKQVNMTRKMETIWILHKTLKKEKDLVM